MVDVVIPVHGQFDLLALTLDALPEAFGDIPYRVYIHDNFSPGDPALIKSFYEKYPVRVSYGRQNLGFPRAVNMGVQKGKNKLVFILNSDVQMEPGSGKKMVEQFEDDDVGVVGMKLLFADNRHQTPQHANIEGKIQHVGLSFSITGHPHHIFLSWSADNPRPNALVEVPAVTGAALMTRRHLWKKLGGFDVAYGRGTFEDVDYCFSVREAGKLVIVDTKAVGHHFTNATASAYGLPFEIDRNRQIFYTKWRGKPQLHWSDAYLL